MAERSRVGSAPQPSASMPAFLTTFGLVLLSIVALLLIDLWLARIDARESRVHGLHLFEDGQSLLKEHRPTDAADRFASAQALERSNVQYGVALAAALFADERVSEAEVRLRSVLDRAETDGASNLLMARILTRQRRLDDAEGFYHRAIYGNWQPDGSGQPLRARLELIDLLARQNAKQELLAELLSLQDVSSDSVQLSRRLGHLFVVAGSPERGLKFFRDLLQRDPDDGDAYAGLGEAALLSGNFRTARADMLRATRLLPDSARLASVLQVADTVLALDPLARGIGHMEQSNRGRTVLQLTVEAMEACSPRAPTRQIIDSARVLLTNRPLHGGTTDDLRTDARLDLASELWSRRDAGCLLGQSPSMRALQLIQRKLPVTTPPTGTDRPGGRAH